MKFVLASHNKKKLAELQSILGELGVEIVLQSELGLELEPEETGTTFAENSLIKAKAVMEASGLPAIADDSGLEVDALNGEPGIYSVRWAGEGLNDEQRNERLLERMLTVPKEQRGARFVCVAACVFPDGRELAVRGVCRGTILDEAHGTGGFGYDPIFCVPEYGCTFGELDADVKNSISHRARAFTALASALGEYL